MEEKEKLEKLQQDNQKFNNNSKNRKKKLFGFQKKKSNGTENARLPSPESNINIDAQIEDTEKVSYWY